MKVYVELLRQLEDMDDVKAMTQVELKRAIPWEKAKKKLLKNPNNVYSGGQT